LEYTGAVQTFKNVTCYKYTNDRDGNNEAYGFAHTTGFGIDRAMHHVYENCVLYNSAGGRSFYGHSRNASTMTSENRSSNITMTNTVMQTNGNDSVFFGNVVGSNLHIRVFFANCYFSNRINIADSSSTGTPKDNAFDVTLLNCGDVTVRILDPNNQYPPKGYGTDITITA
jgi:hypothetical protein